MVSKQQLMPRGRFPTKDPAVDVSRSSQPLISDVVRRPGAVEGKLVTVDGRRRRAVELLVTSVAFGQAFAKASKANEIADSTRRSPGTKLAEF